MRKMISYYCTSAIVMVENDLEAILTAVENEEIDSLNKYIAYGMRDRMFNARELCEGLNRMGDHETEHYYKRILAIEKATKEYAEQFERMWDKG